MNETINKLLLAEDKFTEGKYMLEMHLKHPSFVYSACEPSIKTLKIKIYIYIYIYILKKDEAQDIFIKTN